MMKRWKPHPARLPTTTILVGCLTFVCAASGQDILSLRNGYLTFTNRNSQLYYSLEARPNLDAGSTWDGFYSSRRGIHSTATTVTLPVGFLYRVVGRAYPAPSVALPRTGQSTSYYARDDGELQQGVLWPQARFSDNTDGTITDHLTGRVWLRVGNAFGLSSWADADSACAALSDGASGLTDGSRAGDWRLPSVSDMMGLVDWGAAHPALQAGHPFSSVQLGFYWTANRRSADANAWAVNMDVGDLVPMAQTQTLHVWPVRDLARFLDGGDGTITDTRTGLVWLKDAGALGQLSWRDALLACNALATGMHGLGDGSEAGDWRLPNISELRSLCDGGTEPVFRYEHMVTNYPSDFFWSSTTYRINTGSVWTMNPSTGVITAPSKVQLRYIWPVRDER